MLTADDVTAAMRALGVGPTDTLMVHSRMVPWFHAANHAGVNCESLLTPFCDGLLASCRTLVMPTFTWDKSRGASNCGALTEHFRLGQPPRHRTLHAAFSLCSSGPIAGDQHAYRQFAQLVEADAWVVMLGCDWFFCTLCHWPEQCFGVPYRRTIHIGGGWFTNARTPATDENKADWEPARTELIEHNRVQVAMLGGVQIEAARAKHIFAAVIACLDRNIWGLTRNKNR